MKNSCEVEFTQTLNVIASNNDAEFFVVSRNCFCPFLASDSGCVDNGDDGLSTCFECNR